MIFCLMTVVACHAKVHPNSPGLERQLDEVTVSKLADRVWIHTSYMEIPRYGRVPANGMLVGDQNGICMIDLPWTNDQAGFIFDWVKTRLSAEIGIVVPTHSHIDCAGGLEEAHKRGADSWSHKKTREIIAGRGGELPQYTFEDKKIIDCGGMQVELHYLGSAHTVDNIVVWIPSTKTLFTGCIVKSLDAHGLGNISESDLNSYPKTLHEIEMQFGNATHVVPGHGDPGGIELIMHTKKLLDNGAKSNK